MRVSTFALFASSGAAVRLVTDVADMYRSWGELSVYADNPEDAFGVQYVGLPDGCQVVCIPVHGPAKVQLSGNGTHVNNVRL